MTQDQVSEAEAARLNMMAAASFSRILLSIANRAAIELDQLQINGVEVLQALRNCTAVLAVSGWRCWAYCGSTLDGIELVIVATTHTEVPKIKILSVWRA
jgi:hypothetical protein